MSCSFISKAQKYSASEIARWEEHAKQVTIIRDEWGIAHVYGKTDADAIFGLMYAQSEENVGQIELNYLEMLGRTAEVKGSAAIYEDLMMRLIQDSAAAINDYNKSPVWFKALLQAHADGLNYYLYKFTKRNRRRLIRKRCHSLSICRKLAFAYLTRLATSLLNQYCRLGPDGMDLECFDAIFAIQSHRYEHPGDQTSGCLRHHDEPVKTTTKLWKYHNQSMDFIFCA
jgi:acyl-homoserine lactone acylase PvdQ